MPRQYFRISAHVRGWNGPDVAMSNDAMHSLGCLLTWSPSHLPLAAGADLELLARMASPRCLLAAPTWISLVPKCCYSGPVQLSLQQQLHTG
eukprot:1710646-Karenia_brevis.AAC.1